MDFRGNFTYVENKYVYRDENPIHRTHGKEKPDVI
jgi:hypothetical protein